MVREDFSEREVESEKVPSLELYFDNQVFLERMEVHCDSKQCELYVNASSNKNDLNYLETKRLSKENEEFNALRIIFEANCFGFIIKV